MTDNQIFRTPGRARQKTLSLARLAGVEIKAVVFTRPQLLKALGRDDGKRYGTKRDNCLGRCWQDDKVIWFSLPVSLSTIAHELAHLVTKGSHYTPAFNDKILALKRGLKPAEHLPKDYKVTVITTRTYRVRALTPNLAKKEYLLRDQTNTVSTITARKI